MGHSHPLMKAYYDYAAATVDYRIGVLGQVDAGKSALVNALADADSHISTQTDATRTITPHQYGDRSEILDFPGLGTTEYSPKQYKKLINKSNIKHVLYVFSSKIRGADEKIIRFLAKKKINITFIYNKTDTLVDVSGGREKEMLMHDKDTELHVTFKKYLDQPLRYHFVSIKDSEGIEELKQAIKPVIGEKDEELKRRINSADHLEKFLNKKLNSLATKLLSPSLKDIILKRAYRAIEEMTESHYSVSEADQTVTGREIPHAADYINRIKISDTGARKTKDYIRHLATLSATVFKLRKLNVVTFIASTLGELGIKNIYPVLKGTFEYAGDMNDFARDVIKHHRKNIEEEFNL